MNMLMEKMMGNSNVLLEAILKDIIRKGDAGEELNERQQRVYDEWVQFNEKETA